MVTGIDVSGVAGERTGGVADQASGHCANILDGDLMAHRGPFSGFVEQCLETVDAA